MSSNALKEIRQEVKKYIDQADEKTVKMVHAMLEVQEAESPRHDKSFLKELDRRTKEYENGTAESLTLDELERGAKLSLKKQRKAAK